MAFTCPQCGMVSHNPMDERERYCGRCHVFVDDPPSSPAVQAAMTKFWEKLKERRERERERSPSEQRSP